MVQEARRKRGQKGCKRITATRVFSRRAGPFAHELTAETTGQDPHKLKLLRNPTKDGGAAHNPVPPPAEELLSMSGCLERETPFSSAMQPLRDNPSSRRSPTPMQILAVLSGLGFKKHTRNREENTGDLRES